MDTEVFRQVMPAEFHRRFLVRNRRADGRAFHSYRQPTVATNVITNCSGSASVRCGNSYYLAGVRCEVGRPVEMQGVQVPSTTSESSSSRIVLQSGASQSQNTLSVTAGPSPVSCMQTTFPVGQVSVSVEFPKVCGADFRDSSGNCTQIPLLISGTVTDLMNSPVVIDKRQFVFSSSDAQYTSGLPSGTNINSLAPNAVDPAVLAAPEAGTVSVSEAEGVSLESADGNAGPNQSHPRQEYAWHLFVDVLCLEYDGNPLDCAVLAAAAALEDTWLPSIYWDEDAKWWRQLSRCAERRVLRNAALEAGSSSSKKTGDPNAAGKRVCFIPGRKVQLLEKPVAVTFSHLLSAYWVVDPTREEEALGCWLTICVMKDRWEITRFGGPPIKVEVLVSLKTVAAVIAKGVRRLSKTPRATT